MENKFKPKDTVVAVGYPNHKMVVESKNASNVYTCYWQDAKGKKQTANYHEDLLELWKPIQERDGTVFHEIFIKPKQ